MKKRLQLLEEKNRNPFVRHWMTFGGELWEAEAMTRFEEAAATCATQVIARIGSRLLGRCNNIITRLADNSDGWTCKGWQLGLRFEWLQWFCELRD